MYSCGLPILWPSYSDIFSIRTLKTYCAPLILHQSKPLMTFLLSGCSRHADSTNLLDQHLCTDPVCHTALLQHCPWPLRTTPTISSNCYYLDNVAKGEPLCKHLVSPCNGYRYIKMTFHDLQVWHINWMINESLYIKTSIIHTSSARYFIPTGLRGGVIYSSFHAVVYMISILWLILL